METARPCIGIIGGLGPLAGAHFYRRLIELTPAADDSEHVGVVLIADPRVPSRLAHLAGEGVSPAPALGRIAGALLAAGATLVVIPSSTTHAYYDEVVTTVPIPVLHLPSVVCAAAAARGWAVVGLMATTPTVTFGLYDRVAGDYGLQIRYPDQQTQARIMAVIAQVKQGQDLAGAGSTLEQLRHRAWGRDVDGIILGCTELPVIYPRARRFGTILDGVDELARAALRTCGYEPRDEIHAS